MWTIWRVRLVSGHPWHLCCLHLYDSSRSVSSSWQSNYGTVLVTDEFLAEACLLEKIAFFGKCDPSHREESDGGANLYLFLVMMALVFDWSCDERVPRNLASCPMLKNCWISRMNLLSASKGFSPNCAEYGCKHQRLQQYADRRSTPATPFVRG